MVKVTDDGLFPVTREKVWRLLEAHGTDLLNIHPNIKSVRPLDKEGTTIETMRDMNGQLVRTVLRITQSPPDKVTLDFLEGPMTGKMVNTYTEVAGGTKVVTECDMTSKTMNDEQLASAIRQTLNDGFNEDMKYLNAKMK